jgi:hypothetical protein
MKKVLFVVAIATLLFACQKEPTMPLAVPVSTADAKSVKDTTCSPVPIGLGASIAHDTVLVNGIHITGIVDAYISYKFFWGGYVGQAKMSLKTSYYDANQHEHVSNPKYFDVSSTLYDTQFGVFQASNIAVPVNTPVQFIIEGYNNCEGKTIFTFFYSFGYTNTARSVLKNQQALGL